LDSKDTFFELLRVVLDMFLPLIELVFDDLLFLLNIVFEILEFRDECGGQAFNSMNS